MNNTLERTSTFFKTYFSENQLFRSKLHVSKATSSSAHKIALILSVGCVRGRRCDAPDDWGRDLRDKLIALHADAEHVSERTRRSGSPLRDSQGHSNRGTSAHRVGVLPGYQVPLTRDTAEGIDSLLKANSISDLMSSHRSNRTL